MRRAVVRVGGRPLRPGQEASRDREPGGPHAGDLPNIVVDSTGKGHLEFTAKRVSLKKGWRSLLNGKGTALVMHAEADDMHTDPDGDSRARLACGVIVRAQ